MPSWGRSRRPTRAVALRFRLIFVATWIIVVGGLVAFLVAVDAVDLVWLQPWVWYILGGVPLTILISVVSISLAVVFALIGGHGPHLHGGAGVRAGDALRVDRAGHAAHRADLLRLAGAAPDLARLRDGGPHRLAIFALSFNYGAYMTEIFRAGIQAVPRGQREAAAALGMTQRRIMARVVLPQAVRIVTPAVGNEFIAMIKDSALVSVIGVQELLWRASTIGKSKFHTFETLLLAAAVYWVLTMIFSYFQERLERRMARSDR